MKRLVIFFVLSLLLLAGSSSGVIAQSDEPISETYIILFDESHFQYFTADMMSIALSSLNTSLDHDNIDVTIELVIHEDEFNSTNVQGVDLVMITNPGLDNGTLPEIGDNEDTALDNLVDIGGSVFWLANPLSHNENITGHARPLNDLIFTSFGAKVDAGVSDNDNTTIILDEFENINNNNSYVLVNGENFKDEVFVTELNNITTKNSAQFVYHGAQIEETSGLAGPYSANTSSTAYVLNNEFEISNFQQEFSPRWLYGRDFAGGGKGLLVGSTIMFSDFAFDGGSSAWVEQEENLELFQNMIAWLLDITPLPEGDQIVEEPFSPFFLQRNIFWAFILGITIFALIVVGFWRQKRLDFSNLFNIFIKTNKTDKRTSSSRSGSTQDKQTKKAKRRKRT